MVIKYLCLLQAMGLLFGLGFFSPTEAQVTLTVGNGSGYRGSHFNPVGVSLQNFSDKVKSVTFDVCDADNNLSINPIIRCETTPRSSDDFTCIAIELPGGCGRAVLTSPSGVIDQGSGEIVTLRYNVIAGAPNGETRELMMQNATVIDEFDNHLTTTLVSGDFSFMNCTLTSQCEDVLYCNGIEGCSEGVCTHTGDPCPGSECNICQENSNSCFDPENTPCNEDGLYCTADVCDGAGTCVSNHPCPNATCVEADDLCTCNLPGENCDDGLFCNGVEICNEVTKICGSGIDPCTPLPCDEDTNQCIGCYSDNDCDTICNLGESDLSCTGDDNCPNDYNPDQLNSDSQNGGDMCDICPADSTDTCDTSGSTANIIDETGGTVTAPDDSCTIDIPAGAVEDDTTISITDAGTGYIVETGLGDAEAVLGVQLESGNNDFSESVTVKLKWDDDDNDGLVEIDAIETAINEADLFLTKEGTVITTKCDNNTCGCEDPPALCSSCECDLNANYFQVDVTSFSEFALVILVDLCEGNFDCDADCDGSDASSFKLDFGRSAFLDPCSNEEQCKGDFDCDVDVDGTDASVFKSDFGRSGFLNPCPICEVGDWCVYP